jgi:DNA-binding LytR/AlgR family response regulator
MRSLKSLEAREIVYLKAESNYTIFIFENGQKAVSGFTLKHHQNKNELNGFLRVNRAYLLNPSFIAELKTEGGATLVSMSDGTRMRVSRRRKPSFSSISSVLNSV